MLSVKVSQYLCSTDLHLNNDLQAANFSYNLLSCGTLLVVIVGNLLLNLSYKLNYQRWYICTGKTVRIGIGITHAFRHLLWTWNISSAFQCVWDALRGY